MHHMSLPRHLRPLLVGAALGAGSLATGCNDYDIYKLESQDIFYQLEASEVDVLLVIDNSCSMEPYQSKLSQNFDSFLTYFLEGNVDYQVGVVTTTIGEVEPRGSCTTADVDRIPEGGFLIDGAIITPDTPDADALFKEIVSVGVCGSGYEMGLESAHRAVTPPISTDYNFGFLRDEAYLSIIFVSDEQDASPLPVNDYINDFIAVKADRLEDGINASSLVVTDYDACNQQQQNSGAVEGSRYVDVARQTNGVIGNICADDFESVVTELSLASSRLTDTFYLTDLPVPESLVVGVDREEVPCDSGDWRYELIEEGDNVRGAIVFDRSSMPPPQSEITVQYDRGDGDPENFCPEAESDLFSDGSK